MSALKTGVFASPTPATTATYRLAGAIQSGFGCTETPRAVKVATAPRATIAGRSTGTACALANASTISRIRDGNTQMGKRGGVQSSPKGATSGQASSSSIDSCTSQAPAEVSSSV